MGKLKFFLFVLISGIFAWSTHNFWNGLLLLAFISIINGIINMVKEGHL